MIKIIAIITIIYISIELLKLYLIWLFFKNAVEHGAGAAIENTIIKFLENEKY